ncbi:MAG: S8 family serine peptidase [Cyanobacteria bacterium P01_A01_bin.40]
MTYQYKVNGQNVTLTEDKEHIAVRFEEPAPKSVRASIATKPELDSFSSRFEVPGEKYTILPVAHNAQSSNVRLQAAMQAMASENQVKRVTPVFKVGNSQVLATDRLSIGFKPNITNGQEILQDHGCQILEQFGNNEYLVKLDETVEPFQVTEQLDALPEIEYAEPDFVTIGQHIAQKPISQQVRRADPLATQQYAIEITQAEEAWLLQTGDSNIKIAILDEGVETEHEDLADVVIGSYDGTQDDTFQEPNSWDGHGTACAGLAAAIHGNDLGIKGIGGGCSLQAVRIAYSPRPGANWVTRDSWIRRSIDWSWQNGADILSNSWGGGLASTEIINAFERARTQGRDGKGCIVAIAAGNDSGPVSFPGTLDNVLTVSASNEYDEPKTKTSRDGETWWGSNFGSEVDVAAPGVHNYTTDISGGAGYNTDADGNYYEIFNGTSSATPIVAGAAGLILSANPALTEAEVRQIICDTADKVGGVEYDANGHNDQMGYGRLNVLNAVKAALNANFLPGDLVSSFNPEIKTFDVPEGSELSNIEGRARAADITTMLKVASHTFTFKENQNTPGRLLEQSVVVDVPSGAGFFVCTPYTTGAFTTPNFNSLTERPLGQFYLNAGLRGNNLVCSVRLTDSNADDPIFIQVTATVVFYR